MTIQFNTDNNVTGKESHTAPLIAMISEELERYSNRITRIEAHLGDENADKDTDNDKRCMLEARLEGLKPIAVTNHANTHQLAVEGAIEKLKTVLDKTFAKLQGY